MNFRPKLGMIYILGALYDQSPITARCFVCPYGRVVERHD